MYQRAHRRSDTAFAKLYRFLCLDQGLDIGPLLTEIRAAQISWLGSQWKWHLHTRFAILRGGAATGWPGGELTSGAGIDTATLDRLPAMIKVLNTGFPAPAAMAWIGVSPPGARIYLHIDNTEHWDNHVRIHVPLITSPAARLCVQGRFVHMPAGTVWAFNNSTMHGGLNEGPERMHLILDLPPTEAVLAWMASGRAEEGELDPVALKLISGDPLDALTEADRADADLIRRLSAQ